jgi:hypothetical protein
MPDFLGLVSWGLWSCGGVTQIIQDLEIDFAVEAPLEVALAADNIAITLDQPSMALELELHDE